MKSPYQAAINKVLETIERLDPPCTIEFRSAGAFPTIVEIVPDNRGVDYSVDVGFAIEPEGASPALTAETAARVLSARSQSLEGVNASKQKLAEAWHACAINIVLYIHQNQPRLTAKALTQILYDSTKPDTFCEICPKDWKTTWAFLRKARKDGLIPLQNEPIEVWRRRVTGSQ